ncbi:hypothetical protein UCRPC4_g03069 [Phaeomoniella chlamydospora]|uniref:Uncharacterized protein n=1 Tax=Phaeomoniella chlamydospora TaxID=158046 RepID=A0A0G2EKL8_PHACM|nr:hypothetical protein UCRPC4_g03069 [Phaeomoniella chlamydospora]
MKVSPPIPPFSPGACLLTFLLKKVLDPQSSSLPLLELHTFLAHQRSLSSTRSHDPKIGGYPTPNLHGYRTITKEINSYLRDIVPWIDEYPGLEYGGRNSSDTDSKTSWLETVIQILGGTSNDPSTPEGKQAYGLTKGEVLMILEHGLGMRTIPRSDASEEPSNDNEEEEECVNPSALEEMDASDTQVLHAVVEELNERFGDEEIADMLRRVREIVEEARTEEQEKEDRNGKGKGKVRSGRR